MVRPRTAGRTSKYSSGLRMRVLTGKAKTFIQDEEGGSAVRRNDDEKS